MRALAFEDLTGRVEFAEELWMMEGPVGVYIKQVSTSHEKRGGVLRPVICVG